MFEASLGRAVAVSLVCWAAACSSGSGGASDGSVAEDHELCERAVRTFCAQSCACSGQPTACVTSYTSPSGHGSVALTWSSAGDCAAAYQADWCRGGSQAPASISACADAVDGLGCSDGGAARPDACAPAPEDAGLLCSADTECPGSHCAKPHHAEDGIFALKPLKEGRCAETCRENGSSHVYCGSTCAPQSGTYCQPGWSCVGQGAGAGSALCQCVIDDDHPELSREVCDGKDNDCNGVIDDTSQSDAWCKEIQGPETGCQDGACVPCSARCDGSCVDAALDDRHCGGCDIACGAGEACAAGACTGSRAVVEGRNAIEDLLAHQGAVYFRERMERGIFRCAKDGCPGGPIRLTPADAPVLLPALPREDVPPASGALIFFRTMQDFSTGQRTKFLLSRCPLTGCSEAPTLLGEFFLYPSALVSQDQDVYFSVVEGDETGIYHCPGAGCSDPPARVDADPTEIGQTLATDGGFLYFTLPPSPGVFRCPLGESCDTKSALFESGYRASLLAVSGGFAYVIYQETINDQALARCPVTGCSSPERVFESPRLAAVRGDQVFVYRGGDQAALYQCSADACANASRIWKPRTGETLTRLAVTQGVVYLGLRGADDGTESIWALDR